MGKTYFIDIDGTIVPHLNNSEIDNLLNTNYTEELLPGVKEYWSKFEVDDRIIITTARTISHKSFTEKLFRENDLRYDQIIFDLPSGPRILINDYIEEFKAIAFNVKRNEGLEYLN